MTSKSVFANPLPGDRLARRLVLEINRIVDIFMPDREEAVESNDPRLIQQVNQMLISIEQTTNELRSIDNIPDNLDFRQKKTSVKGNVCSKTGIWSVDSTGS